MKLFIAIAVVLGLLAITRAQDDDSSQVEPSDQDVAPSDPEEESSDLEPTPADESRPSRPENPQKHPKPGRPGRRPLRYRISRPQIDEDQPADNENSESNSPHRRHPPRRQVFFDIDFVLGKHNIIRKHRAPTTTYTTAAAK